MFSYALDNEYGPTQVPPEVGGLQVAAWEWGYDENQEYKSSISPIKSHACSDFELGRSEEGTGAHFFPLLFEESINAFGTMMCIDEEELRVHGTYSSNSGRILLIMLNRCIGEDYCLDEKEAKNWFSGRYIVI